MSIKVWFIVKWELFRRWLNRKEEFKYTISFFIGMYFREQNESNKATNEQLDKIDIVDIDFKNDLITIYCFHPLQIDRTSLDEYLRKSMKGFNGKICVKLYTNERLKSLKSFNYVCKDFNDNDEFNYDF